MFILGNSCCIYTGKFAGTVTSTSDYLNNLVMKGFSDAGAWVVVMMMWVAAFGGIMKMMDAFKPLSDLLGRISRNVRQLMFWNAFFQYLEIWHLQMKWLK